MNSAAGIAVDEQQALLGLGVALAIGLLFGLERGWHGQQEGQARRSAGLRTFGLLGLLGGTSGLLAELLEPQVYGWMFLAVAAVTLIAYAIGLAREKGTDSNLLGTGILIANATLFPRILIILALTQPSLIAPLALPLGVMTALIAPPALLLWRRRGASEEGAEVRLDNPLALGLALRFGLLLALVMGLARLLSEWFGETGLITVAAFSGLLDVNAITLTIARLHEELASPRIAAIAILVATTSNALFKTAVCGFSGSLGLALRVGLPLIGVCAVGLSLAWFVEPPRWFR